MKLNELAWWDFPATVGFRVSDFFQRAIKTGAKMHFGRACFFSLSPFKTDSRLNPVPPLEETEMRTNPGSRHYVLTGFRH